MEVDGRLRAYRKQALFGRIVEIGLLIGLISYQQYQYDWSEQCDYDLKVWSTVCLSMSILRSWFLIVNIATELAYQRQFLTSFIILLDLFSFCWFLYGIQPILVDPHPSCAPGDSRPPSSFIWSVTLWTLQALYFLLPVIFICFCVPLFLCLIRIPWVQARLRQPSPTNQMPTPPDVRAQLHPMSYSQAVLAGLIDQDEEVPAQNAPTEQIKFNLNHLSTAIGAVWQRGQSIIGHSMRANPESGTSLIHEGAPCPICVTNFAPEDIIVGLPCNPRKHVFHMSCIHEWLIKSQLCPICRANIVDLIREGGAVV